MILKRVYLYLYKAVAVPLALSQTCEPLLPLCVLQTLSELVVQVLSWQLQRQELDVRSSYILNWTT